MKNQTQIEKVSNKQCKKRARNGLIMQKVVHNYFQNLFYYLNVFSIVCIILNCAIHKCYPQFIFFLLSFYS